ncbi:unnamed protein product [Paramecium sonneborni]|uniref:PIPK domain-containing protein n=1 Tax=Paramecium sonneborni TaxID=65129 RepID=A0A8S1Q9B0_9CILI|nr:unnamed protein product [Paramecium sonneborni]
MIKIIIQFLILSQTLGLYSDDDVFYCQDDFTDVELSEKIKVQPLDQYIFLIISPLAFMCTMFITYSFIQYPNTRKMPGDIVFFISMSDAILCIHWFLTALYYQIYQENPLSSGVFCQTNSMFSIFAGTGEVSYNVVFCIYLRLTLKNQFKVIPKLSIILHTLAWIAMISIPLLAKLTNNNGLSIFGTCSFKFHPGFPLAGILLVFCYTIISVYTIVYFNKAIPDDEKYKEYKDTFAKYYYRYIKGSCIIWTIQAISFTIAGFNCSYFHQGFLLAFITIGNSAKLCTPVVLSILRYNDPTIKQQIKRLFRKLSRRNYDNVQTELLQDDTNFYDTIHQNLKFDQVNTIIFGIRAICQSDLQNNLSNQDNFDQIQIYQRQTQTYRTINDSFNNDICKLLINYNLKIEDFHEEITYNIDNDSSQNEKLIDLKLLQSTMIVYAPAVFQKIRQKDNKMINHFESFDLIANQNQIKQFKGPDGGKGGAFFFFSYDNKLIIKTLSDQELLVIKKNLLKYFLHIQENETIISPIYGIYKLTRQNVQEPINVVVMRNVMQIPSEFKIRTYDIKGSEHARQVIKKNQNLNEFELQKVTLKDIDFQKFEKKLHIPDQYRNRLKNCLINDATFFGHIKLMDYSLLIVKMDWYTYSQKYPHIKESDIPNYFSSDLYCIPSTDASQRGIYYHIAIIDYLQEWNASKIIEKHTKKAIHANIALDTSAQNPEDYANRFIEKVAKVIV